jgi:HlyD family secretion protein
MTIRFRPLVTGLILSATGLGLPFAGAVQAQEAEAEAPAAEILLPAITVSEVRPVQMRDRVVASGMVAAVEQVNVQPLVSGEAVQELLVDVGAVVEAGQVLARLETTEFELQRSELEANRASVRASIAQAEANLIEARANADEAQRVAERAEALREQGNIAQAQADQVASALESAQARVRVAEQGIESAQAQLAVVDAQVATLELRAGRTEVTSPAGGLVVQHNATVGEVASSAGQPMFVVARDGEMELRAEVAEVDLMRLQTGQAVTMTAVGSTQPLSGTIRLIEPVIDTQTRMGVARIALDDDRAVLPGMFLTADILVREGEMLAVPSSAVGSNADGATVMRVVDGVVEQVAVVTGIRDGGLVEIVEGLNPGDLVVTKAASFVRNGDSIMPVPEGGAAVDGQG